jgi:DNA-binding response OmpR family regulator
VKDLSESRILIVDDVKTNIDILVEALRDEYKLSVAMDGAAALRSVEKSPPDLVLLDIVMPGLDGYEVCRRLRAQESTRELPIMFLSSLEDVKDKTRGFEAGGNDYLTKPFEMLEVKARVRSLLKAKSYTDAVREAMARDLLIAREIQMGILPTDLAAGNRSTAIWTCTRSSSRHRRLAATSMKFCAPPTTASSSHWATCRGRGFQPRSSWPSP